jgi:HSP20 family protein
MSALTIRNNNNYGVNILDDLFGSWGDIFSNRQLIPAQDLHAPTVRELEDSFEISVAAPGLEKKDFSISVEGSLLTVGYDATDKPDRYAYATKYSKSYTLPHTCDAEKIEASYKSGVLVVGLPKSENSKHRQIKIK